MTLLRPYLSAKCQTPKMCFQVPNPNDQISRYVRILLVRCGSDGKVNFAQNERKNGLKWISVALSHKFDEWTVEDQYGFDDDGAENLFLFVLIISWQFWHVHDWLNFLGNLKVHFFKTTRFWLLAALELGFKLIIQFSLSLFSKLSRLKWI